MAKNPAKKDAENFKEIVDRLQDTLKHAEQNVAKAFKDLGERLSDTQHEAKKRVDELLGQFSSKELVDRLALDDAFAKVASVRQDFEDKLGGSTEALWLRLGVATKADLADVQKKLAQIGRRLKDLEGKRSAKSRSEA